MKIISWNTYLAPTMPGRFTRKHMVVDKVIEWIYETKDNNVSDIIALQELNDFTIGIFGYLYYTFKLYLFCNILMQRFFDIIFILEGFVTPFWTYNNSAELYEAINVYNNEVSNKCKYHITKSRGNYHGLNSGLVIISRELPISHFSVYLPTDLIHSPGLLYVLFDDFIFVNNHLLPDLLNYNCMYKFVNAINYMCCIKTKILQEKNILTLRNIIRAIPKDQIFIAGDFNIKRKLTPKLYKYMIDTLDVKDSSDYICTQHHIGCLDGEKDHEEDQIDYILSNKKPRVSCKRIDDTINISDHYPIVTEY